MTASSSNRREKEAPLRWSARRRTPPDREIDNAPGQVQGAPTYLTVPLSLESLIEAARIARIGPSDSNQSHRNDDPSISSRSPTTTFISSSKQLSLSHPMSQSV
ncbi:riboflavin kinase [Colletotrichum acutatum]